VSSVLAIYFTTYITQVYYSSRPTLKEGTVIVVVQVHFHCLRSTLRAVWNVSAVE